MSARHRSLISALPTALRAKRGGVSRSKRQIADKYGFPPNIAHCVDALMIAASLTWLRSHASTKRSRSF